MVRRIVITFVLLLAFTPTLALAQDEPAPTSTPQAAESNGTLTGRVINGTEGGDDVAGLEVVLTRYVGMEAAEEYTAEVGEDGTYEFTDLPTASGQAYLATVTYKDVEFNSEMILLSQEPNAERDIMVYEKTNDASVLSIVSRGVVIAGANEENSIVEILEIIAIDNQSDRVFVGDENGEVLRLSMPENASNISPQSGFNFGQLSLDGNVLVSTGSVSPGSHNPMISYSIPFEGGSTTLEVGTAMETGTLRVLVEEDTYDISSQVLTPAGTQQVGEASYTVLAIDQPVVGDTISVEISGLPHPFLDLPVENSTLLASLAAGVGLVIAAILMYQVVQRRRLATEAAGAGGEPTFDDMNADELERERLELASELNQLDSDYERGEIDQDTYQSERDQVLGELKQISLRMRGLEQS